MEQTRTDGTQWDDNWIRCLACTASLTDFLGNRFSECPNKDKSDHSEEFKAAVARSLRRTGELRRPSYEQHMCAVQRVAAWWKNRERK